MKAKAFRLARVLRYRERELEKASAELATLRRGLEVVRVQRQSLQTAARRASEALGRRLQQGLLAGELRVQGFAVEAASSALRDTAGKEREAEEQVFELRSSLWKARANVRALETLRSRALESERHQEESAAQREIDEIALRGRAEGDFR